MTFGFNRTLDEPLIKGLSLTVPPGSRVALVGDSGSGKSTIGRLAAGFIRPWEGEILYDGFPSTRSPATSSPTRSGWSTIRPYSSAGPSART